jgi:hypothetical protein
MGGEQHVGLYQKYKPLERMDGSSDPGKKHENCRYFPLDMTHDPFAKPAILAYAAACADTHPVLAADLRKAAEELPFSGGRT